MTNSIDTPATDGAADRLTEADVATVRDGDTWAIIAARAGVDVGDLLAANIDLGRPSSRPPLVVGQSLALP